MINAMFFYRISRWFFEKRIPFFPKLFTLLIFLIYNSKIPYQAVIGKGTFFTYGGIGCLINSGTIIGENCSIGVSVKIVGKGPFKHAPKIGNNVFIGPGAVIQGPVIIDDNVIIAPNAVVTKSVPNGYIVGGIPAKKLKTVSDLDFNIFMNECYKDGYMPYME